MIGGNVTENEPMVKGDWRKVTNEQIVASLVEKIEELLDGEARHYIVADKKTSHRKIVIEYDHSSNLQ